MTWAAGAALLYSIPFLGLILVLFDPPTWVEIVIVALIVALVATGSTLMRRRTGGWRPSETVTRNEGQGQ